MLEQGSMVCSSGNKPIGMESRNIYSKIGEIITPDATSLNNTSKNALNVERMSPASVDSGFDSSFPSSPDCSLDSSVSISGADTTKCYKDSNFKRRHQTAASLNAMLQCPLSICQPSCSTLSSPTNHTSSDISTFSTKSLINIDSKTNEHFCLDACLLKKTVSLTLLSSSLQLEVDIPFNQDSGVPSIARLDKSAKSLARYSTIPSFSGNASSEVNEVKSRVRCHWKSCAEQFACDNDLYDHVVKFIWLEEHFTTRHAGKAQPYMCLIEGCSLRFTLKRSLEEHLRTGHEKAKAKRSHTEEGELSRVKSCYQWTPLPYYIPNQKNDFLDHATEEWIVMRLRQYERTTGASFIPREPATPRGGAAYRKRRRILTFAIEPLKIAPKVISDTMGLADAKSLIKSAFINAENSLDRTVTDHN